MLNKHINKLILLAVGALLSACASTATHFYTLEARSLPTIALPQTGTTKAVIGIGPLSLPALLDRRGMVTRAENNSVHIAEFDQWAAPLSNNVIAVLGKNVATLQPNAVIRTYPWSVYGDVDYRVIIDISRFDARLGKSVNLEASWAIMEEKNHTIVRNGQTTLEQPLNEASYSSAAQGLSTLLSEFGQQLSVALVQTQQQ